MAEDTKSRAAADEPRRPTLTINDDDDGDALVPAATPRLVSAYAAELAFESSKLSWRTRIADYLRINPFAYSAINTICTFIAIYLYLESTSFDYEESVWENRLDAFLSLWFFLVYCFEVWLAHDRLYHCVKYETVCDLLSVLPGVQHLRIAGRGRDLR